MDQRAHLLVRRVKSRSFKCVRPLLVSVFACLRQALRNDARRVRDRSKTFRGSCCGASTVEARTKLGTRKTLECNTFISLLLGGADYLLFVVVVNGGGRRERKRAPSPSDTRTSNKRIAHRPSKKRKKQNHRNARLRLLRAYGGDAEAGGWV